MRPRDVTTKTFFFFLQGKGERGVNEREEDTESACEVVEEQVDERYEG